MDEFPPNTKKSKPTTPEEKPEAEKIITGEVVKRKTPLGTRIKRVFGGNVRNAGYVVLAELIVPTIKGLIVDAVSKGTERVVMGETQRQMRRGQPGMGSRITYNSSPLRQDPRGAYPQRAITSGRLRLDEVVLTQREDAVIVVESMLNSVDQYGFVSVADLYHLLGWASAYTDEGWGWSNLVTIAIKQVREGYLIELPDPEPK
jgi:hypothetical protein